MGGLRRVSPPLAERVALVTGAGSEIGIGFACARILGGQGAQVAITSTTEDRIQARAGELQADGLAEVGCARHRRFSRHATERAPQQWSLSVGAEWCARIRRCAGMAGSAHATATATAKARSEAAHW